jgi:hypothetical protein
MALARLPPLPAGMVGPDYPCMLVTFGLIIGPSIAFMVLL